jgi:hypothetical protein
MNKPSAARLGLASLLVCASSIFFAIQFAAAQSTACPAGQQPATASDLATMTAAGISNPVIGMCWSPSSAATGAAAAQAKQYLQSSKCSGNTIDTNNLNSGFALCAQKFVQSAKAQDPNFCISSAYRSAATQLAVCMAMCGASSCPGRCAAPSSSFHQYGLAIDVLSRSLSLSTIWALAQQQGILNPTSLHSSDPYHIQAQSKTGGQCNSGGSAQPQTPLQSITNAIGSALGINTCQAGYTLVGGVCTLQTAVSQTGAGSNIYSTPGLGSTPQAGQILTQDSYCMVSTNPVITYPVPAGTPYPSNCLNGTQATCPAGYTSSYGTCIAQTCPAGYTMTNGFCAQTQQQTTQSGAATGASTAALTASTPTSATNQTTGAGTSNVSAATITTPTLAANLGTSTEALLQALANPQSIAPAATNTPITLSGALHDITQLEASGMPGVTNALPTSSLFPSGGPVSGAAANGASAESGDNTVTTTAGTGYDIPGTSNEGTSVNAGTAGDIASTQAPSADTFGSSNTSDAAPNSFTGSDAPSTFGAATLSILAVLKADVLGALTFLSIYGHPFGGNTSNQITNE